MNERADANAYKAKHRVAPVCREVDPENGWELCDPPPAEPMPTLASLLDALKAGAVKAEPVEVLPPMAFTKPWYPTKDEPSPEPDEDAELEDEDEPEAESAAGPLPSPDPVDNDGE